MLFESASMSEVVGPAMRDTLSSVWGWKNVVRGTWSSVRGSWLLAKLIAKIGRLTYSLILIRY